MNNFTKNGKCSKCGSCCSNFLPLTQSEIKELQELVKLDTTEVQLKYSEDGRFYMMCPFLIMSTDSKETRCSIYDKRPSICRYFRCDRANERLSAEESRKYTIVDIMKDIIHYDYQKETGISYEGAMRFHLNNCINHRKKVDADEKKV